MSMGQEAFVTKQKPTHLFSFISLSFQEQSHLLMSHGILICHLSGGCKQTIVIADELKGKK
jgi:hypothetical protein